jgi:oligopeptide transport system substrate-binding protein
MLIRRLSSLLMLLVLASCQKETQVEKANREGILIVGNSAEPKALDPQLVTGVVESKVITALFEGLVAQAPDSDDATPPGAATSWEHNEQMTEWTFHLRPEAKWSDGMPVTSEDFVFAYQRMLCPDLAAPYVDMLYFIKNAEAYNQKKITDFSEVGVKTPDPYTLKISLKEPVPFLPGLTRHYTWFPVPKHVVLKFGKIEDRFTPWSQLPNLVGNGAFRLKDWKLYNYIEVEKNPHYWNKDHVKLNGVRFLPVENAYTETRAFLAGQLHITSTLPSDLIKPVKNNKDTSGNYRQEPYVATSFIRLNTTRPGLSDVRVRKALALTVDRKMLCEYVMEGFLPTDSLTPKMGKYLPDPMLGFDPEKARALLAEAGYPNGKGFPRYSILITKASARATAEAIQAMWKDNLNILVDIQNKDWGSYIGSQQNLDFDLALAGWTGDYLDPTTFLNMWLKGGGNNNTGWSSTEFESLLSQAALEADSIARLNKLKTAEHLLMDAMPIIPMAWNSKNYLIRPEVKNWSPLLLDSHPWSDLELTH